MKYKCIQYIQTSLFSSVVKVDSSSSSESGPKTSDEIMDDVLKQLKKLNADKKQQILDILKNPSAVEAANANTSKNKRKGPKNKATSSLEDEVEILDMSEPKMGTYKRKRSMRTKNEFITCTRIKYVP